MLGGSSGINYQMYVRGSDQDYDDWAALTGDEGWGSKEMKKYMKKHQTLEPLTEALLDRINMPCVEDHHGTTGPVRTSFNDTPPLPIQTAMIAAADEVTGYKKPVDPWSGDHIGFFNTLGSVIRTGPNKGKRSYAARGYLGMAEGRSNLKIICEAMVNRINLQGDRATGVNFTHNGQTYDVQAKREVLVTGGAVQSPQILELSGIGNPDILRKAGVEPKITNNAVGENFQDHSMVAHQFEVTPGTMTMDAVYDPAVMQGVLKQYMETQGGPLTGISPTQGFLPYTACVQSEAELEETVSIIQQAIADAPSAFRKKQLEQIIAHLRSDRSANIQLVFVGATGNVVEGIEDQSKLFAPTAPGAPFGVTVVMCAQYPASRGSVHIRTASKLFSFSSSSLLPFLLLLLHLPNAQTRRNRPPNNRPRLRPLPRRQPPPRRRIPHARPNDARLSHRPPPRTTDLPSRLRGPAGPGPGNGVCGRVRHERVPPVRQRGGGRCAGCAAGGAWDEECEGGGCGGVSE
jgi:choline dehydrogenase-like flavoprotein